MNDKDFVFSKEIIDLDYGYVKCIFTRKCINDEDRKNYESPDDITTYPRMRVFKIDQTFNTYCKKIPSRLDLIYHSEFIFDQLSQQDIDLIFEWYLNEDIRPFKDVIPHTMTKCFPNICICTNSDELRKQIEKMIPQHLLNHLNRWCNLDEPKSPLVPYELLERLEPVEQFEKIKGIKQIKET